MTPETIEVSVTFGAKYTFFLRMIGLAEEQQIRQKSFGVADEEKAAKEFELNVQILADLSVTHPVHSVDGGENSPVQLTDLFAEKTPTSERIAYYAVRAYFLRLLPSESFF